MEDYKKVYIYTFYKMIYNNKLKTHMLVSGEDWFNYRRVYYIGTKIECEKYARFVLNPLFKEIANNVESQWKKEEEQFNMSNQDIDLKELSKEATKRLISSHCLCVGEKANEIKNIIMKKVLEVKK